MASVSLGKPRGIFRHWHGPERRGKAAIRGDVQSREIRHRAWGERHIAGGELLEFDSLWRPVADFEGARPANQRSQQADARAKENSIGIWQPWWRDQCGAAVLGRPIDRVRP